MLLWATGPSKPPLLEALGSWPRRGPLGLERSAPGATFGAALLCLGPPKPASLGWCGPRPTTPGLPGLAPPWGLPLPRGLSAPGPSHSRTSAESQTLLPLPIWPTLGPQHLDHGGGPPPELNLTPLGGLCSSHAAEQGAKAGRFCGSAGPDPRRDLGDLRLWDTTPVPSHSHTTDWGSRLNPKDWSAMF